MNLSAIRKNANIFFSILTLLFAIAYFSSSFNYYIPHYAKPDQKSSIEEFVTPLGGGVVVAGQQLCKITGLDYFVFDLVLRVSSGLASFSAFFVSHFERNVYYTFTTINAP